MYSIRSHKHRAVERVNVYVSQQAKDAGVVLKTVRTKPYSLHGYDSYAVDGRVLPGYLDRNHHDVDACVILTDGKTS